MATATSVLEYVTFYVGDVLLGADIQDVQEINRYSEITRVPRAPETVCGVMNLRGDVVTVIDLCAVLGFSAATVTPTTRIVIVTAGDEKVGLLVDRVADVAEARDDQIEAPPANVDRIAGRFFNSVCRLEDGLLATLNLDEVLAAGRG